MAGGLSMREHGLSPETETSSEERTVRLIFELANRGLYAELLQHYHPGAQLDLGGGEMAGGYAGTESISGLIEVAIKEYGQPRVRIVDLHCFGSKVYVETHSHLERPDGQTSESHEVHILRFSNGKVESHKIFSDAVAPERIRQAER
ncbi:MAG TPA: nuclear transport factor 2 family protein [Thermoplasmata archaeon]|nr:nuclear transport factor 2 family protein [Thermoplasmata archaeon]